MEPARRVAPLRAGRRIRLLMHLPGVEVWKHLVAEVFQNERLAPVAHDQPVTLVDSHFVHCTAPKRPREPALRIARKAGHDAKLRDEAASENCAGSRMVAMSCGAQTQAQHWSRARTWVSLAEQKAGPAAGGLKPFSSSLLSPPATI